MKGEVVSPVCARCSALSFSVWSCILSPCSAGLSVLFPNLKTDLYFSFLNTLNLLLAFIITRYLERYRCSHKIARLETQHLFTIILEGHVRSQYTYIQLMKRRKLRINEKSSSVACLFFFLNCHNFWMKFSIRKKSLRFLYENVGTK